MYLRIKEVDLSRSLLPKNCQKQLSHINQFRFSQFYCNIMQRQQKPKSFLKSTENFRSIMWSLILFYKKKAFAQSKTHFFKIDVRKSDNKNLKFQTKVCVHALFQCSSLDYYFLWFPQGIPHGLQSVLNKKKILVFLTAKSNFFPDFPIFIYIEFMAISKFYTHRTFGVNYARDYTLPSPLCILGY